ncbi:MAG: GntR family transcriptional regulator [Thermomicrobiales bacterium]|nr:GntR family transcriptional regulator [Thermomicrobiales bacterium]MCO5222912.1 GntR family transcriptional regulator [Thermomicrobiales bacterium]
MELDAPPNGKVKNAPSHRPLRLSVVESLRDAISSGSLKPGQRIVEQDLAKELGVSRLPIREAIRQLEYEGLLESIPHKGAFVATVSERDIRELFSLRDALETLAAGLVAQRASPGEVSQLQSIVDQMREQSERRDFGRLFEIDTEFHTLLCTYSQHGRLVKHWSLVFGQWRALDSLMDEVPILEGLPDEHPIIMTLRDFARSHQGLVDAIRVGDIDGARAAMQLHMEEAQQSTLDIHLVARPRRSFE